MTDLENFLTEEERTKLATSRRQADNYFDAIGSLEDELLETKEAHQRHINIIGSLIDEAEERKKKHLAEIEAGLSDLTGGAAK
jgi:uncharacterized protein involved in exopolysaccharide biosynthesis